MGKRQDLDILQQDFELLINQEDIEVESLTELFGQISAVISQQGAQENNSDSETLDLVAFKEWLSEMTVKVSEHKSVVANELASVQKSRFASKSYSANQK